jgi:hypothetical protein
MKTFQISFTTLLAMLTISMLSGCNNTTEVEKLKENTKSEKSDEHSHGDGEKHSHDGEEGHGEHGHGAGPHDGTLADWGGGKYHVEFTVDHDKKESAIYILGSDEKSPVPIKADKILLSIKEPSFQVELVATPLEGEAKGTSSRFVGKHDNLGIVREFEGTISAEVDGTPYAGNFKEEPHEHDE